MVYCIIALCLITALSLAFAITCQVNIKRLKKERDNAVGEVEKRYVKVSVALQNAVLEAIEWAHKKGNNFEVKKYSELLQEIKGKWA